MEDLEETAQSVSPPGIEKTIGKKRKRSASSHDDDDQPAVKYLELAEVFTLDRFSDEVLFEIFKNLDTFSLLALEKTCTRFFGLVQDHRLWTDINIMAKEQTVDDIKYILERANKKTIKVKVNGFSEDDHSNTKEQKLCLLKYVVPRCEILLELELQNVFIDFMTFKIRDFPKNLKRLVFRNVSVQWPDNAPTVFQKMDKFLIFLEELAVESCSWFHPYDLMLFSKCPSLKRLSMRGCNNLTDFVPYGSMASRFGFKALEYLDVRETPITDSDLQCFNAILTLKELLLECPTYLRENQTSSTASASTSSSNLDSTAGTSGGSSESAESATADTNDNKPSTSNQRRRHELSNIMTIDLQNHTRTIVLHGRVCEIPEVEFRRVPQPNNEQQHFGNLLQHPHFWDMIERQTDTHFDLCSTTKPLKCPITNRGISCFGRPANPIDQNVIWIRIGHRPSENTFERLSLRHYSRITNDSLKHLVQCSPSLIYLDVSGSGVTQDGVNDFKAQKPECEVICEHIDN